MKKAVLLTVIGLAFILVGCSNQANNNTTQNATKTAVPKQEISDVDPLLKESGFIRLQLTDPALFNYLEEGGKIEVETNAGIVDPSIQKKIGSVAQFKKTTKYGISGTATILTASKIKVSLFSYNGSCGPIKMSLITSNNPTRQIAVVKEIGSAVTNSEFNIDIPSNITLIKFDGIGVYCTDSENPISTVQFNR